MDANRTIVLGLDGAHFELIDPWLSAGSLPNIRELMEEGLAEDMDVCLPPVTSPNWKCYSSGKNPGKVGIFWWENIDTRNHRVYYPVARKNEHEEIWDCLGEAGQRVCVIGTPLTYPPKDVNGVMVAGGLDCSETGYTTPPELQSDLESEYGYRVHPEADIKREPDAAAAEIHDLIETRFEVALDLMAEEEYDFVQITSFYLNVLQHFLWDSEATEEGWKIVDSYLGELRRREPEANVILMSDHGSNRIETVVNVNRWLHQSGYLQYTWRYALSQRLAEVGLTKNNARATLDRFGLRDIAVRLLPERVRSAVPDEGGELRREAKTDVVDWERSAAIASGQGPVYLLDASRKEELETDLETLVDGVAAVFETADPDALPDDGDPVFRRVYERDELYSGEYVDEAPAFVLDQGPNVHIKGDIGADRVFDTPDRDVWRADNKRTGMFVGAGPDLDGPVDSPTILDLAPTILDIHGVEPPEEMDGSPLFD